MAARGQPGVSARQLALDALIAVRRRGRPLDEAMDEETTQALEPRDRGFARALITTAIRRQGQIDAILKILVPKALPRSAGPAPEILVLLAAELLFLKVAAHAAVSSAVNLAAADRNAQAFRGLINAVGRKLSAEGEAMTAPQDAGELNTPPWLYQSWTKAYGRETARAIAEAHLGEAPLDLTAKGDPGPWVEPLEATLMPNGTLRRWAGGRIESLEGFEQGAWWVQDLAASLPVALFGPVQGKRILDLCAAPGGKTLSLAANGAQVTAIDRSGPRLQRLRENLQRTGLTAQVIEADGASFGGILPFDGVLIDAPCSSTGTLRRHPDVAWAKRIQDLAPLSALQDRLLANGAKLVDVGGTLVYAVCSLQPEEGEARIAQFLIMNPSFQRRAITASEIFGMGELINAQGDLRALPCHLQRLGGLDGFFAARLVRLS
jgi:16S rRNA (cytosine967-C5)-methyltransferase